MGLLDLLRKLKKSDREAKILILGLDNAGKTTLLKLLSQENPNETSTTKGFNVKTIVKDSKKLNVWDIGGQKEIRQYWENYYDNVDGLIYVVDSSDDYRLNECSVEFKLLISVRI
jgi:ADP-ribosylation factor-like protein 3